jgi:hypothetical protein
MTMPRSIKQNTADTAGARMKKFNDLAVAVLGNPASQGAVPSAAADLGVLASEANGAIHKTEFAFTGTLVAMTDAGASGSSGSLKIFDLPEGNIVFLGGSTNLTVSRLGTAITATAAVVGALGTVAAAADATLTSTEADLLPSAAATLTAGAGTLKSKSLTAGIAVFDGTATAKDVFLNFAIPDAGSTGNDSLVVSGTVTLLWASLGDN